MRPNRAVRHLILPLLCLHAAIAQEPSKGRAGEHVTAGDAAEEPLVFKSETQLVTMSFHVTKGKGYINDLKSSDVVLLEDGKPREFTIFDAPSAKDRPPFELVLLFDANAAALPLWDPAGVYRFIPQWNDSMSRAILESDSAIVRISVYRCAGEQLIRSNPATSDARTLTESLQQVLSLRLGPSEVLRPLTLPPGRKRVGAGTFTNDYVTSPFYLGELRGWVLESALGVLKEVAATGDRVSRVFVMFSQGIGATTSVPDDVRDQALDLGIPIYPVATNYLQRVTPTYPRNFFRMQEFMDLGKLTGGRPAESTSIDAAALMKIIDDVKTHAVTEYVIGFSASGGSKRHSLEIKLAKKVAGTIEGGKRRAVY